MTTSKNILIFSTASGFCHKSTIISIRKILADIDANIDVIEFYDIFGSIRIPFSSKRLSIPDIYNRYIQQRGNTGILWFVACLIFQVIIKLRGGRINKKIDNLLIKSNPDMVFSIIPLVNNILSKRLEVYSKDLKLHTIVVDFCQPFPNVWLQSKNQVIYGWNEKLIRQATNFGISSSNIVNLGGQLITPELKEVNECKNGITFIVFVIWGGNGCKRIINYAQHLEATDSKIEINYVIGENENLYNSLKNGIRKKNSKIHRFISDIKEIYSKSDLIIGKPGPAVIAESIFTKTPLLLELNRKTLIQERYNAKWASLNEVALLFKTGRELKIKLQKLAFGTQLYEHLKLNTYKIPNSSFEIFKNSVTKNLFDGTKKSI